MARNLLAHACLLATLVVAGAMPTAADLDEPGRGLPDTDIPDRATKYGPSCSKSDDDSGFGGTQVSCKYACGEGNLLAIGGNAADPDALAYGDTTCGGATAICQTTRNICRGVSEGTTSRAQTEAKCSGGSDEFWSSPMTIACASHGTDPAAIICHIADGLCTRDPGEPIVDPTVPKPHTLKELCEEVAALADRAVTFVLAQIDGVKFNVVAFDPDSGCQVSAGIL